jgi:hypothetical protein
MIYVESPPIYGEEQDHHNYAEPEEGNEDYAFLRLSSLDASSTIRSHFYN